MTLGQLLSFDRAIEPFAESMLLRAAAIELTTDLRWAHFLAQVAHESVGFLHLTENLNYSAKGLQVTFPKYFRDPETAAAYARKPVEIANRVYAGRIGNGDAASGDGWRYRGRGLIQITGRDNYRRCSIALYADDRLLRTPELLESPDAAVGSAGWYWTSREINTLADRDDLHAVTRKVNGGLNGIEDRLRRLEHAKTVFGIA